MLAGLGVATARLLPLQAGRKQLLSTWDSPTSAFTRDGADVLGGALAHADRRRLAGTQENMVSSTTNVQDALRQATAAEARSRIRSAVDSGGDREITTVAAQGVSLATPLRRALRQDSTTLTDAFRAVQRQERVAASTAMIRRAVNGEMDVAEAISGASARPKPGSLVSSVVAERAAGTAPQRQQLP